MPEVLTVSQTIAYGSCDYVTIDGEPGIYITQAQTSFETVFFQKFADGEWVTVDSQAAAEGTQFYQFRYPYNTTDGQYRIAVGEGLTELAVIDLTVKRPSVRTTVKKANSSQYVKYTSRSWNCYPVIYRGTGPSNASTTEDIREWYEFVGGNYDLRWDKKQKATRIAIFSSRVYEGQRVVITDRCRHRTWSESHKDKVFRKTVSPAGKRIVWKFDREQLQYENHCFTVKTYVMTDRGEVLAGTRNFHVHVKDKGEQIVDSAARYLGRVNYSNFRRGSITDSTKSVTYLSRHLPPKCYADCSSYASFIYYLHGLWSGDSKYNNKTASMGPNARRRPAGYARVKRYYKNMGSIWMVNNMESGHMYSHAAIIVGNNYYINVTAHDDYPKLTGFKANACYQKCTPGSRNFTVADVYNYRSW